MKLIIKRFKNIDDGTIGEFVLYEGAKAVQRGYTLEPAGEDTTQSGKDRRIPAGLYQTVWHDSPRFKRVLPLLFNDNVPKSRYILIHAGNYPKHTQGCILLGASYTKQGVFESVKTLEALLSFIQGKGLEVEIINDF